MKAQFFRFSLESHSPLNCIEVECVIWQCLPRPLDRSFLRLLPFRRLSAARRRFGDQGGSAGQSRLNIYVCASKGRRVGYLKLCAPRSGVKPVFYWTDGGVIWDVTESGGLAAGRKSGKMRIHKRLYRRAYMHASATRKVGHNCEL